MDGSEPRCPALVCGPWRIDVVCLDGQQVLRIRNESRVMAYCPDKKSAIDVLRRHAAPLDHFVREDHAQTQGTAYAD